MFVLKLSIGRLSFRHKCKPQYIARAATNLAVSKSFFLTDMTPECTIADLLSDARQITCYFVVGVRRNGEKSYRIFTGPYMLSFE